MSSPLEVPSEIVQREPGDTDNTNPSTALLDSWKQIHGQLTKAVLISQEAIAAKKLQRRYWMEEICANLTEEGKLTHSSVWKRAVPSKKSTSKKAVTKKRKKTEQKSKEPKQKKAAAKKKKMEKQEPSSAEESKVVPPKKLTIKLKKPPKEVAPPQEEESVEQESQVTSDEEKRSESEMDSGKKLTYQDDRRYDDREESHESGFGQGPPWGPRQTDNYMVSSSYSYVSGFHVRANMLLLRSRMLMAGIIQTSSTLHTIGACKNNTTAPTTIILLVECHPLKCTYRKRIRQLMPCHLQEAGGWTTTVQPRASDAECIVHYLSPAVNSAYPRNLSTNNSQFMMLAKGERRPCHVYSVWRSWN